MKKMKKIFALLIAMVMVMGMSTSVFAASITIQTDETYEGSDQAYVYDAYKIFDATYDSLSGTWTQENKDAEADIAYTPTDAKVAYFMKTGNPWISTIQAQTTYFTVTAAADESGYTVVPTEAYSTTEAAKALATTLKNALTTVNPTGEYAAKEITAGGSAVSVDAGYYLIVGRTAANLALVTTDVTIVEKNEYAHILKEFSDETSKSDVDATDDEATSKDDSVQIGDTVSYTLTVVIPSGANQAIVVTDKYGTGLNPVLEGTVVKVTAGNFTGTPTVSAPADGQFTITLSADDVIANQGKTVTFVYEAVVTADAWYQTQENTGELKYGNDYDATPDKVDSVTYNVEIDKKADSEDGDSLKGAQFELYRTDTDHSATKAAVYLVALTDEDLTTAEITKAADTVYYRVAASTETGATTTIDMTNASASVIYGLDGDSTYYAREIKAPTGYNILTEDVELAMNDQNHVQPVVNNAGTVLPSTGGMGTTLFYILGTILVMGAGIVLVTRRKLNVQ